MPMQRRRFGTPLFFEFVGAFVWSGSTEVELIVAIVTGVFQHCPVKQHIRGHSTIVVQRRGCCRKESVLDGQEEESRRHCRDSAHSS